MRTRTNLVIDVVVLTTYLLAANPLLTGIAVHEWIAVGFALAGAVHLTLHGDWVARTVSRFFERLPTMSRLNLALDAFTAAAVTAVMVSGLAVSRSISSLFGLTGASGGFWSALHAGAATALVAAILAHVALHWRWILAAFRLHVAAPIAAALWGGSGALPARAVAVAWSVPTLLVASVLTLGTLGVASAMSSSSASDPTSAASGTTLTCPATGCTASTCHAASGTSATAQSQAGSTSSSTSSSGGTLTCPRTGCTAASCHATSGGGGRGGRGGFTPRS